MRLRRILPTANPGALQMPITQSRMLSLLAAAQDYKAAFETITERAAQIRTDLECHNITPEQACHEYSKATLPLLLLSHPYESPSVIAIETLHFTREKKRNERNAQKARENRLAARLRQPKPQRGDGREYGGLGAPRNIQSRLGYMQIEPSIAATAPRSSAVLARQHKPSIEASMGDGVSDAAQRVAAADAQLDVADDLDFVNEKEDVAAPTPTYIPDHNRISPEEKVRIEQFSQEQELVAKFSKLADLPQWGGEKKKGD